MKKLSWTVRFTVDETWVADGFTGTEEDFMGMLGDRLPYAYSHELNIKIVHSPKITRIAKMQGYGSDTIAVEDRLKQGKLIYEESGQ